MVTTPHMDVTLSRCGSKHEVPLGYLHAGRSVHPLPTRMFSAFIPLLAYGHTRVLILRAVVVVIRDVPPSLWN